MEGRSGSDIEDKEKEDEEVFIDDFLKSNYYLFNILSVFGAIALFLTTIGEDLSLVSPVNNLAIILNMGIIGSLLLFVSICFLINIKYAEFMGLYHSQRSVFPTLTVVYATFLMLFDLVAITIAIYVSMFGHSLVLVLMTIGAVIVASITFHILSGIHTILNTVFSHSRIYWLLYIIAFVIFIAFLDLSIALENLSDLSEMIPTILSYGVGMGIMVYIARHQ